MTCIFVNMFHPEHVNKRSQDLEPAYHDAGQFYWINNQTLINKKTRGRELINLRFKIGNFHLLKSDYQQ